MWANKFHSLKDCVGSVFVVSDPATSISFAASSVNTMSLLKSVVL